MQLIVFENIGKIAEIEILKKYNKKYVKNQVFGVFFKLAKRVKNQLNLNSIKTAIKTFFFYFKNMIFAFFYPIIVLW